MLTVFWSDRLENLARHMFDRFADGPGDPFRSECVVVNSPLMQGWLKQHFLFDRRGSQRVLANWDFLNLYEFVNDWLAGMEGQTGEREAVLHPYSKECLRWRIHQLLGDDDPELDALRRYIGPAGPGADLRRFGLAGQLARLFDDYQNYRALTLVQWENGDTAGLEHELLWQPALWNRLVRQEPHSYLAAFLDMDAKLPGCGIRDRYGRICVFGISSMPPPYIHFFEKLGAFMEVTLYCFNPSRSEWFDDKTPRQQEMLREAAALTGRDDIRPYLDESNPLLSSLGKGCQSYLAELMDRTGGQAADDTLFGADNPTTLLEHVQCAIRDRQAPDAQNRPQIEATDDSVQFHICHSPAREVEVLRDHILAWFAADTGRQPRDIQVLVADMETYAPYIDAVFATDRPRARDAIPYVMADRPASGASLLAASFLTLLRLPGGRFTAPEVMGLLETDAVREAFGLDAETVAELRNRVHESGIRWGVDQEQVTATMGCRIDDSATWRRGLDRMLLGYAMGRAEEESVPLVQAGDLGTLRPLDTVEGDLASAVGALGRFFEELSQLAAQFSIPCGPAGWEQRLLAAIDTFYRASNENYQEIAMLRRAVRCFVRTAAAAGECVYPLGVVAAFIETQLQSSPSAGNPTHNAVLFSSLRTMRATSRPILCLLGVNDGVFPRPDDRPAFDLMAKSRRRGDRSARLDDRLAFLEAILCARKRLYISYVGRSVKSHEVFPPSPVISEFLNYLCRAFALPATPPARDGAARLFCEHLHRLQAFHPDYFTPRSGLISYSGADYAAARRLVARLRGKAVEGAGAEPASVSPDSPAAAPDGSRPALLLAELQRFFRNPAREFCRHTLRILLDDTQGAALADAEMFKAEGLAGYERENFMLEHLLSGKDPGLLPDLLREAGLAPLGIPGRIDVQRTAEAIHAYLGQVCKQAGCSAREFLALQRGADPIDVRCALETADVTGTLRLFDVTAGKAQLFARYAAIKPKDQIGAWIAHLLGCAVHDGPLTTFLLGQKEDKLLCTVINAVAPDAARARLDGLLELYNLGRAGALPFAPATSQAYANRLRAASQAADPRETEAALVEARKQWLGPGISRGEADDVYLRCVWGEPGPMVAPDFGTCATRVWNPCLAAMDATAGGPADDDDGGPA